MIQLEIEIEDDMIDCDICGGSVRKSLNITTDYSLDGIVIHPRCWSKMKKMVDEFLVDNRIRKEK